MSRDYKSPNSSKSANGKSGSAFFGGFVGYALGLISAIGIWLYISYAPSPFLTSDKATQPSNKSEVRPSPEQPKTPVKVVQEEPVSVVEEKPRFDFYKILPGIDEPEIDLSNKRPEQRPAAPPSATAKIPEISHKPLDIPPHPVASQPGFNTADQRQQQSAAIQPRSIAPDTAQSLSLPQTKHAKPAEKYFLQAGSFKNNDDAENLKARLALLGMYASIQPINLADRGVWYRVRVGPFNKKEELDEASVSLRENGIAAQFVRTP